MGKKTYFLSDLHLGAPYFPDSKESEKRVVAFLDSIKNDAESIYLLGDVLDYWYEYRHVVPRGFVRFFGKLAEFTDAGIKVVWMIGNHDIWIFDYIPNELGVEVIDGSQVVNLYGKKFFLTHGDGVGKMKKGFRIIRGIFRNKFAQWMFAGIHPRWTVPFAYSWSRHSRKEGEARGVPDYKLLNNLENFVTEYHKINPDIDYFIFGHIHILSRKIIEKGCEMIVLGDWINKFSYAELDEKGLRLMKWDGKKSTEWPQ